MFINLCGIGFGVTLLVADAAPGPVAGWNGDNTGVFRDYKGPTSWNVTNSVNILWKARMPNWCNGSPIAIADRAVAMSEPLDYAPTLLCFDAASGKELWRRDVDPVEALPDAERAAARKLAQEGWAWKRQFVVLSSQMHDFWTKNKDKFSGKDPDAALQPEWQKFLDRCTALDVEFKGFGQSAGGYPNLLAVKPRGPAEERNRKVTALGLQWSSWFYQGTWNGVAFPTPCSDGKAIYVVTAHNIYAAYDVNGTRLWLRRFPPASVKDLTPEQKQRIMAPSGKNRWPGGWPGQGHFSTSPILFENRLISCAGMWVRCLDTRDGRVVWELPMRGEIGQNMANPGVMVIGTTPVVIVPGNENRVGERGDDVIRLADGRVLFRDLKTHQSAGTGALPTNSPETENDLLKRGEAHGPHWKMFSGASPFAYKDRLYIRGFDYLWCIGRK